MKELPLPKKKKVIARFLMGETYDEIALGLGIAKGSVVNIIDAFRNGGLPIALNEYIDALRELAVDIRKQNTTIKKLKMYVAIDKKLVEMGVGTDQLDDWLDIVQDIATEPIAMKPFVSAVIEMSHMEMDTGLNCTSLVAEYKNTSKVLDNLKVEMANTIKLKNKENAELESIIKARKAAQEDFDDYMMQKQLNWEKVNIVMAILEGELAKANLDEKGKVLIAKHIAEAASLAATTKGLKEEKEAFEEKIAVLKDDTQNLEWANVGLQKHNDQLASHVYAMMGRKEELDKKLEETKLQVGKLKTIKYHYAEDIFTGWVILAFLHNPEAMSDYDFDKFVEIINGLRLARLGQKPKQILDAKGKIICQCQVPMAYIPPVDYGVTMEKARHILADCLMPLVSDKFISKNEFEQKKLMNEITEIYKKFYNALSANSEALCQPVEQQGPVEQNNTSEEVCLDEKPSEGVNDGTAIPKAEINYWSPEAVKARWELDNKFSAKVGPRTNNTKFPWEGDK